jgi:multisubunit Na+/H+ antiporter MnhB subunit
MNFFSGIFAGNPPPISGIKDFDPSKEEGFIHEGSQAVEGGEVVDHWFFSVVLPEWIQYILSFSAAAAVLMIVAGGVMIMMAGEDEEYKTRGIKTLTWSIAGLIILVLSYTIIEVINKLPITGTTPDTDLEIQTTNGVENLATGDLRSYIIPQIIKIILQLMGTAALILLLYAGGLMVLRDEDEERVTKARSLIIYAIIGIIVSVLAYAIVEAVLQLDFR